MIFIFRDIDLVKFSLLIACVSSFTLGILENLWIVIVVLVPTIFSLVIQSICITSCITKTVSNESVGTVLGVAGSLASVCRIISPFIGGVIIEQYGMLGGMALVSFLSVIAIFFLHFHPVEENNIQTDDEA